MTSTVEEYNNIFTEQEGECAICNRHISELEHGLHFDEVSLVCGSCLTILKHCQRDIETLERVIDYLEPLDFKCLESITLNVN
jgi:hypothetical protein